MKRTFHFSLCFLLLLFFNVHGRAQTSVISTFAGPETPIVMGVSATGQAIDKPRAVLIGRNGEIYIASSAQNRVYRIEGDFTLTLIAGSSYGFSGDGGSALTAQFRNISGLAQDSNGNLYIADTENHRIRRVNTAGFVHTVAGSGTAGYSGDGGSATSAQLNGPVGLAVDAAGNLYIADQRNNRIRYVGLDGRISTFAGNGNAASGGDGGVPTAASILQPGSLALDNSGNLYIAETGGHRVRKVSNNAISTVAGTGSAGFSGEGGQATQAQLNSPGGLAVGGNSLYISDTGNHRVRRVFLTTGQIGYLVGDGTPGYGGDGGSAFFAQLHSPSGLAVDALGTLRIADTENNRVRIVADDMILTLAGNGTSGYGGDFGSSTAARLNRPRAAAVDALGNLYIADTDNHRMRRVTPSGLITPVSGTGRAGFSGDTGPALSADLNSPDGVAVDAAGTIYISDTLNHRIRKVLPSGIISTAVGLGTAGFAGDGGLGPNARISSPGALATDVAGNLYISDTGNRRIRRLSPDGRISTVAGNGNAGDSGDGGDAIAASLNVPRALATDSSGNLYIADTGNRRIRKVSTAGVITTVAGTSGPGIPGTNGDGQSATGPAALLDSPSGVAVDSQGNILIAETNANRIRAVFRDGVIRTIIGIGSQGFSGDGGAPAAAQLSSPEGLALEASGILYIADTGNHRIRRVTNPVPALEGTSFTLSNRGGASLTTQGAQPSGVVGYAQIQTPDTSITGLAIFGYRQGNVLISEAAVPSTRSIRSGRIYGRVGFDAGTFVNTGLAIANPNESSAVIQFFFTGTRNDSGSLIIPPRGQFSKFLDEFAFNAGSSFEGSFTFTSNVPVAVTALRGVINERNEFLVTTLPVAETGQLPLPTDTIIFPHFADGGGWTTQLALVNPTDSRIEGTIEFVNEAGSAVTLTAGGQVNNTFRYNLGPRESFSLKTSGAPPAVTVGSVRVVPLVSNPAPAGLAIFSYRQAGVLVTEAGVPAVARSTAFRMYVEAAGNFEEGISGSIQSGIAITNLSNEPATVTLSVSRLDGSSTGLSRNIELSANGQIARFLNQIPGLSNFQLPFQGLLRISSTASISVVGLRGRYNERREFLITTTSSINEAAPPNGELFFPHFADSGGYTTQFILIGNSAGSTFGTLRLVSQLGQTLGLTLR